MRYVNHSYHLPGHFADDLRVTEDLCSLGTFVGRNGFPSWCVGITDNLKRPNFILSSMNIST
jgi:hypothetical protein